MSRHRRAAKTYGIAIVNHAIGLHRGKAGFQEEVSAAASGEQRRVAVHRDELRTGALFQFRQPSGVIVMRMAIEEKLYVLKPETELSNVRLDHFDQPVHNLHHLVLIQAAPLAQWESNIFTHTH